MAKVLTLGEIMLRLSNIDNTRIVESKTFATCYGGGEANVAISLANFGHEVNFASKLPDNFLGAAAIKHLQKYEVGCSNLLIGGQRLGTYYLEQGISLRSSQVIYDRCFSSFSMMKEIEWAMDKLFLDVELIHISGITPALSSHWQDMILDIVKEAKKRNILVSFDINYRSKLWSVSDCAKYIGKVAKYIDYCSAGCLDAINFFMIEEKYSFELIDYYKKIVELFPNIKVLYSTTRTVYDAKHNQLTGHLFINNQVYNSKTIDIPQIVDRVGGGDAFAAGVLHGLLDHLPEQQIIDFATAASALKHTIFGDCNQFKVEEIEEIMNSDGCEIKR